MSAHSDYNRDMKVIAAAARPRCGARPGERCRNPVAHQNNRGPEDRREQPTRPHNERRAAWSDAKRGI